jgi:hypothetical protein
MSAAKNSIDRDATAEKAKVQRLVATLRTLPAPGVTTPRERIEFPERKPR